MFQGINKTLFGICFLIDFALIKVKHIPLIDIEDPISLLVNFGRNLKLKNT